MSYESARQAGNAVAQILREMALLIGDPGEEPVTPANGTAVMPGLGLRNDAAALLARAHDLSQGLFTIIVLGEFKNGKSTLLNAMLGSKTLPAKAAPATAIITVLVYGNRPEVAIYETDRPEPRLVSWEEFGREFQLGPEDQETIQEYGTLDRFSHVEYAEMERPHALCALGVKLIDSPGLGEHISRTRVATDFLKRSQAVIMVLNATRILTRDERAFIESTLGQGRLPHVFFVVNRINQVDPDGVASIEDWVESQLAPRFLDAQGRFDEDLYRRRVFFLNARGALDARASHPVNDAELAASRVPALEAELERFLAGQDKVAATLRSTVQFLQPVLNQARERIEQAMAALDAPLTDLEQRREAAESRLRQLEGRKEEIECTIMLFGDALGQKVYADLLAFATEAREMWDEDSRRLMDLDRAVSLRNVLTSYAQREARERMAAAIGEEAQRYVQAKFEAWSNRIPGVIEPDLQALVAEVEAQMDDMRLELDRIAAGFAGTGGGPDGERLLRPALSVGEIEGITEDVMGISAIASSLGQVVQQPLIGLVTGTLRAGRLIAVSVLAEAIPGGLQESEIKQRIRRVLGERLTEALREQIQQRREFIRGAIEEEFQRFATGTVRAMSGQIDEVRADQDRILEQKRRQDFSAEQEKARLAAIGTELDRLNESLRDAWVRPSIGEAVHGQGQGVVEPFAPLE